jgi:hypothetical protein
MALNGHKEPTGILRDKDMTLIVKSVGKSSEIPVFDREDPFVPGPARELARRGPKKVLAVHLEGKDQMIEMVYRRCDPSDVEGAFYGCKKYDWEPEKSSEVEWDSDDDESDDYGDGGREPCIRQCTFSILPWGIFLTTFRS